MQHRPSYQLLLFSLVLLAGQVFAAPTGNPPELEYEVVTSVPHRPAAFTQGLEWNEGWLYESSGQYGRSFVTRYRPENNSEQKIKPMPDDVFAEGLTVVDDAVFLLSWRKGVAWQLDKESFAMRSRFRYSGEGWGLAYDGEHLVMSDGSAVLRFFTPDNFELVDTRRITYSGRALNNINELEYVDGVLWANRWHSSRLFAIDLASGEVIATVDCRELRQQAGVRSREGVLNGIAHDPSRGAFWVTGKNWRTRFLIRLPDVPRVTERGAP